jgi:hypothetical protein
MKTKTNTNIKSKAALVSAALFLAAGTSAQAALLITNGGFESGLTGWTRADQVGSDGTFFIQSGTSSPLNGFAVPAAPEGFQAAMTDSAAGGAHALYQDFVVPSDVTSASVGFSLFLNNGSDTYINPAFLDWAQTNTNGVLNLNQQARVDIVTTGADLFSVVSGAVLQNLFQTSTTTPLVTGYNAFNINITSLLQAHAGETLRLRFAETDNVNFFNFGVDNVSVNAVPAPSALVVVIGGLMTARRRRGA